jgi:opacity protein-like surface antigen
MRKLSFCAALVLLYCVPTFAEDVPKVEVFGGYSHFILKNPTDIRIAGRDLADVHLNGWNGSAAFNLNRWLGVAADFSGHYGSPSVLGFTVPFTNANQHSFLFGPRVTYRSGDRFTPFGHALFGGAAGKLDAFGFGISETTFAMAFGGGLDVRLTDRIAVRAAQIDYLQTRFGGDRQNSYRLGAGIVFRLGEK